MGKVIVAFLAWIAVASAQSKIKPHKIVFEKLHQEPTADIVPMFRNNINMNYIEQKLDHFDNSETRTWFMRYLSNDYYFKDNGPIFIYIGGEWTISEGSLRGGHMYDMAKELNGYMFYTEHRFYGRSQPMNKLSLANLKYLSTRQANADLAHFINTVKATIPGLKNAKVILVGGSYSATMATWFWRDYPDLVQGSWASSAPLFAKADFFEYKEVMGKSIRNVAGDECYNRIHDGIKLLEERIKGGNIASVRQYINMCEDFDYTNARDISSFFYLISELFASLVQSRTASAIQNACNLIMSQTDASAGLGAFIKSELPSSVNTCIDYSYKAEVSALKDESLNGMMRQWYYQTCNEFAWFQTSTSLEQPFGSTYPVDHFYYVCRDVYGTSFSEDNIDRKIQDTNVYFGGLSPPHKDKIFFSHGALDPWHAIGLQLDDENGVVIPLYSHCKDLSSRSASDSAEMANAKEKVFEFVKQMLA